MLFTVHFGHVLIVGMVFIAAACADVSPTTRPSSRFHVLAISQLERRFADDADLGVGGGPIGGHVRVWINGDLVTDHRAGGLFTTVGQWLHAGANSLRVVGVHDKPLYVKVASTDRKYGDVQLLTKAIIEPQLSAGTKEVRFDVRDLPVLPKREVLPQEPEKRDLLSGELRQIVRQLEHDVLAGRGKQFAEMVASGRRLWMGPLYGATDRDLHEQQEATARFLSDPTKRWEPPEGGPKLEWGRTAVTVWTGEDGEDRSPYWIRTAADPAETDRVRWSIAPLRFARVDGRWVVWSN